MRSREDEPLFRARLIGIGYDSERGLVLIELREDAADEDDEDPPPPPDEAEGRIARFYATRAQIRAMMRNGVRGGRGRAPATARSATSRWTPPGTSARVGTDAVRAVHGCPRIAARELLRDRRGRRVRPDAVVVERDLPREPLADGDDELLAIYKPQRGERPLWDFPRGTLCHREVAAFEVSEALGWDIVPDTVLRDGPLGIGMVQRFVEHDPEEHYFTLLEEHGDAFRRMAAFDVVINNTDRKGGHCLRDARGRPHLRASTTASRSTRSGSCAP